MLGVPYEEGFVKNRYIARTFIMPSGDGGQHRRAKNVRLKLNPVAEVFRGRRVCLVDDSIVRGTTSRILVQMARDAGATEVCFCSAAPPVCFPNVYGIDLPDAADLVARDLDRAEGTPAPITRDLDRDGAATADLGAGSRAKFSSKGNELAADRVAKAIGADCVVFQELEVLEAAVRDCSPELLKDATFDSSCFTGEYVTGGVDSNDLALAHAAARSLHSEGGTARDWGATAVDLI